MVGFNCKINSITFFACAYPQHGGGEGVIKELMQLNTD